VCSLISLKNMSYIVRLLLTLCLSLTSFTTFTVCAQDVPQRSVPNPSVPNPSVPNPSVPKPSSENAPTFRIGLEVLQREDFAPLRGKKIGLIVNHSAVNRSGAHAVDIFHKQGLVTKLFAPEHGIRGTKDELINNNEVDSATGLPIFSLYQATKKEPSEEELKGVDALVFDIQEIGVRYYTYATTMVYCMKAAAKAGVPFYVLDRPNMASPLGVYGPIAEKEFHGGFTSLYPMPIAHGMTMGELAQFYNTEFGINVKLTVIPMQGYKPDVFYDEQEPAFPWRNPSPNIRSMNAVIGYHLFGALEDITWSVGRGTESPFTTYGVSLPNFTMIDGNTFIQRLNAKKLPGLSFGFIVFNPSSSKLQGKQTFGFTLNINDRRAIKPFLTMMTVAQELHKIFPDTSRAKELDRTARSVGSRKVLAMLKAGKTPFEIEQSLQAEGKEFLQKRSKYLMYTPEAVQKRGSIVDEQKNTTELDFETVRKVIQRSIHDSAFPSAALGVLWKGNIVTQEAFGTMTYSPSSAKTTVESVYDMASLTKVLATTTCLMKLYDEGKIKLDDSVSKYIPEFAANGKGNVRIANLLLHNSGLAAFRPYDRQVQGASAAMKAVYNEKLTYKTGDSMVYSDLGFITLGEVVKRISGKSLDVYFAENIARPLGLKSMMFVPSGEALSRCVPTEQDTGWQQAFTRPLVHDPRSALLGGVAGHAGLFASVGDVCTLMRAIYFLPSGKPAFISPETVKLFTTRHSKASTRAIGWDTKGEGKSSCGDGFAPTSFGHTGYTGTSVWCDPTKELCVVFLTNRVHPTSENIKIRAVRPAVHDAVLRDVANAGK
jgi:uncharacterized protein YbbC (DUF1343 family)/CubicO group peptidase (beta-lactamase class C family)